MSEIEIKNQRNTEIGEMPASWQIEAIGNLFDVKQGKQLSSKETTENKKLYPFLRTSNIMWGYLNLSNIDGMYFSDEEIEKLKLRDGDILVCEGGDIGRTAMFEGQIQNCAYQNHLHRLRPKKDNINRKFFVFWMNYAIKNRGFYVYTANRTTIPNLSSSRLKNFKIPLPPLPEQKKIAAILSRVQEAKEKTEAVIDASKALKKSMMKHLFTYGPVSVKEADSVLLTTKGIGTFPKYWDIVRIGDVASLQGGCAFKSRDYRSKGIALLKIANVSFGTILWNEVSFLPVDFKEKYSEYLIHSGDLLIAMTRPIVSGGIKVARAKKEDCPSLLNQRVGRFILNSEIDTEFLFQILFNKSFVNAIGLGAIGSQQPNISAGKIEQIKIPLPPIVEQKDISVYLSSIDDKIRVYENRKKSLEKLFQSLLKNLMTGKLRVKNIDIPL